MHTRVVKHREEGQRNGQITAVIYARASSDALDTETMLSLDEQVEGGRRYCEERGYHVGEVYQDIGPGWGKEREGFRRMVEDGKSGRYQRIVCHGLDRLCRGLTPLVPILELVDDYGIEVEGVNQLVSKESLALPGVIGKMENDQMRERTTKGRRDAARQGRVPTGSLPYGYHVDEDGRPLVNEDEAAVIREIFRLCIEDDLVHRRVAHILNSREVPSPAASKRGWSDGTVSAILRNEVYYTGKWYYGRTRTVMSQEDGKVIRRMVLQPEFEWIQIDFPTIVSEDVWNEARGRIQRRTSGNAVRNS